SSGETWDLRMVVVVEVRCDASPRVAADHTPGAPSYQTRVTRATLEPITASVWQPPAAGVAAHRSGGFPHVRHSRRTPSDGGFVRRRAERRASLRRHLRS